MARKDEKAPAYQWYPRDADSDEAYKLMTYEQQGVYRALLDHQWLEGSLPTDPTVIGRLLPKITVKHFLKLWAGIAPCFREEAGRLVNPRLEDQRTAYAAYRAEQKLRGQRGAGRRWANDRRDPVGYAPGHAPPIAVAMPPPSKTNGVAIVSPMPLDSSASASASASAKERDRPRDAAVAFDGDAFMNAFRSGWEAIYGFECSLILDAIKTMQVHAQVKNIPRDRLLSALAAYFATTEDYVRKAKHPLGLFLKDPLRFLAVPVLVPSIDTSVDRVRALLKETS